MRMRTTIGLLAATLAAACVGTIGDGAEQDVIDPTTQTLDCEAGDLDVGETPLRRLTRREYNNAIHHLFGDASNPAEAFIADETIGGFAANSVAPPTKLQVEDYLRAAEAVAAAVVADHLDAVVSCDVADASCVGSFLDAFGPRILRRPLTAEARASFLSTYTDSKGAWGAPKAFELMVQTLLMSPEFLYHVELTLPADGETVVALDGYEIASRLSFFLWQSVPDELLIEAATSGALDTPEGVASEALRMIAHDHAKSSMESFFGQYLEIEHLDEAIRDGEMFPSWSADLGESMQRETFTFVDRAMRNGGDLTHLLTSNETFVDADLADLYGVTAPSTAFGPVSLDAKSRAGILTQASFLTGRAHAAETSWVERGKFVRERLLCNPLPPPPPGVDMNTSNDPDRLTNSECKTCHILMDPIGTGFEQYDAIGRFDENAPTDPVELLAAGDLSGTYESPVALATALAQSETVQQCIATHWFRYAARREQTPRDKCSLQAIDEHFAASDLNLSELLVAIATSDAFRFRRVSP